MKRKDGMALARARFSLPNDILHYSIRLVEFLLRAIISVMFLFSEGPLDPVGDFD